MERPNITVTVKHSETKPAWNIVGTKLGGKYKIAQVPYIVVGDQEATEILKEEALQHANFISYCFNHLRLPTQEEIGAKASEYDNCMASMAESTWMPEGFKEGANWVINKLTEPVN